MSEFKLPQSITVKGEKYKVKQVIGLKVYGNEVMGLHDQVNKEILINKKMTKKEKRVTFLHELFHAYCFECNIREGLDSQLEEVLVETISQAVEKHFAICMKGVKK